MRDKVKSMTTSRAIKFFGSILAAALLSCCSSLSTKSSKSTDTNFDAFIPPRAQRLHPRLNQKVVVGEPQIQAPPVYPPQMVKKDIPRRSVCLTIAIDRKGAVYQSRPLYGMPGCPASSAAVEPAFVKASQDAVMQWSFSPTLLCTFPKGVDATSEGVYCIAEGAEVKPIPIRLAFVFTFTQIHGETEVHTDHIQIKARSGN